MTTKELTFTFDEIEELTDMYIEEMDESGNAAITYINEMITLTVVDFKDCNITVYHTKETPELYQAMDEKYVKILEDGAESSSDYWDKWNAVLQVLEPYKIVDEVLNP